MTLRKNAFENIVGKGENAVTSIFSFSHSVFYDILKTNFNILVTFMLSSANALNLDQSKILSFGKGIVCSRLYFETFVVKEQLKEKK